MSPPTQGLEPIPDKLVVLTFDDSAKSHYTTVRPILKRYGFGATFFVTEGFDFPTNKTDYMTWQEIAELHRDGFEIGNHTRDHISTTKENVAGLEEQVEAINKQCIAHGIPRTISFGYPANVTTPEALPILKKLGIRFARRGGSPEYKYPDGRGFAYEPGFDHPLLVPSAGDARPDWTLDDFIAAVKQARQGRIAVLQFHGVPDTAHAWVNTSVQQFDAYMNYLAKNGYTAIAMRDLAKYVDADLTPSNPQNIIDDREQSLLKHSSRENFRRPQSDDELHFWLTNMLADHRFTEFEVSAATGLSTDEIAEAVERLRLPKRVATKQADPLNALKILPYPGGRHPRIGFLDGAIRPLRETKFSAFLPWNLSQYVVVDVPEAIWIKQGEGRELLYLAHTDVPTMWSRQGIALEPLEWIRENGSLRIERKLPNQVSFGAEIVPTREAIRMELWLTNGTRETLRGLVVQNCVMLKAATEFNSLNNDNKIFRDPFVACRNAAGDRWIITAWQNCVRAWGNAPCPCLHSDPQFPDCAPGETQRLHGWLSFYEGKDIEAELSRIDNLAWRKSTN
ncbi:MAG: polysaccharide deacetylase family protein [Planctomycetes bacterium]|nr:polysaccharide deacetylase family protein [Planctomycetota bacterium]